MLSGAAAVAVGLALLMQRTEIQDEWVTDDEDDGEDDPSPTSQEAAEQQKRDEEERAALNAETRKQTTKSKAQGNIMSYFGKKS